MLDVAYRILASTSTVKQKTISPHIEATKRIMKGDDELLEKTLLADEFDILKAKGMIFSHLPNEYKLHIGYDDIELVQMFDALVYLYEEDENRKHLNEFVKGNLKSMNGFLSMAPEKQHDVLNTYWDILSSLDHETNRVMFFVRDVVLPRLNTYTKEFQFALFRTGKVKKKIGAISALIEEYKELLPDPDYMENVRTGGIQREL
ncbi:MAG: hypothetical protein AB2708_02035 [Candidatus Thiodiazotropha taylori]